MESTYDVLLELGRGSQGSVYLVEDTLSKVQYAAKVVRTELY
jgi:serine/threonine protein kinase